MRRSHIIALVASTALLLTGIEGATSAKVPGPNGMILFARQEVDRESVFRKFIYIANPDGTGEQRLTPQQTRFSSELARWSPDGSEIALVTEYCQAGAVCAAYIVDADTGAARTLPSPDESLPLNCGVAWSIDGRLACVSFAGDPSEDIGRDGIYTMNAVDGSGLTRVTTFPALVGDFSPDGQRLVVDVPPDEGSRLAVVNLNGGVKRITPRSLVIGSPGEGSWSPDGAWIVFSAADDLATHRLGIWVVHPDGSGLHKLPIPGCGGPRSDPASVGCLRPRWSPDGTKIAFDLFNPHSADPRLADRDIYTVNADGTKLTRVTKAGIEEHDADWGTHPLTA